MDLKINKLVILVMLLIVSSIYVSADLNAVSSYERIPICNGEFFKDKITITNLESVSQTVAIKPNQAWSTLSTPIFTLEPHQSVTIENFIKPPIKAGEYDLVTSITTNKIKKELHQYVEVKNCQNIEFNIKENSYSNCPCTPTLYSFNLTNTGHYIETYDLDLNALKSYFSFSQNTVVLRSGETKTVYLYINMPCDYYGNYSYKIKSKARISGYITKTPIFLNLRKNCFDYDINLGKEVKGEYNTTVTIPFNESETNDYKFCKNDLFFIPFEILNTGENKNLFTINSDLKISTESIEVDGESNVEAFLTLENYEVGIFDYTITFDSDRGEIKKAISFNVEVDDCGVNETELSETKKPNLSFVKYGLYLLIIIKLIKLYLYYLKIN